MNKETPASSDLLKIIESASTIEIKKQHASLKREILEELRAEKEERWQKELELIFKNPGFSA